MRFGYKNSKRCKYCNRKIKADDKTVRVFGELMHKSCVNIMDREISRKKVI
jgi:hypothetical protein